MSMYKRCANQTNVALGKLRVRERATADVTFEAADFKRVGGGVGKLSSLSSTPSSSGKGFFMSSRLPLPRSPSLPPILLPAAS